MVSLEEEIDYQNDDDDDDGVRLNIFQNRVENLATVIIPSYLNQLEQQKKNIQQYQTDEEWQVMSQEQRNATKTIKQLRTHIVELDEVKEQVTKQEHDQLNKIIEPIQTRIMLAVTSFQELEYQGDDDFVVLPTADSFNTTAVLWKELQEELEDLQTLNHTLSEYVKEQRDNIDTIDHHVNESNHHLSNSLLDYASMTTLRANMLPIGGAIIGGVVGTIIGGPLGFMAGTNIGTITTIAGGAAGAAGGTYLGIRRGKQLEETTQQLKDIATNHEKLE